MSLVKCVFLPDLLRAGAGLVGGDGEIGGDIIEDVGEDISFQVDTSRRRSEKLILFLSKPIDPMSSIGIDSLCSLLRCSAVGFSVPVSWYGWVFRLCLSGIFALLSSLIMPENGFFRPRVEEENKLCRLRAGFGDGGMPLVSNRLDLENGGLSHYLCPYLLVTFVHLPFFCRVPTTALYIRVHSALTMT